MLHQWANGTSNRPTVYELQALKEYSVNVEWPHSKVGEIGHQVKQNLYLDIVSLGANKEIQRFAKEIYLRLLFQLIVIFPRPYHL